MGMGWDNFEDFFNWNPVSSPDVAPVPREVGQALSVHVALEQRALVPPPGTALHLVGHPEPVTAVDLGSRTLIFNHVQDDRGKVRNDYFVQRLITLQYHLLLLLAHNFITIH